MIKKTYYSVFSIIILFGSCSAIKRPLGGMKHPPDWLKQIKKVRLFVLRRITPEKRGTLRPGFGNPEHVVIGSISLDARGFIGIGFTLLFSKHE